MLQARAVDEADFQQSGDITLRESTVIASSV